MQFLAAPGDKSLVRLTPDVAGATKGARNPNEKKHVEAAGVGIDPAGKNMQSAEITVEFLPNQIVSERHRITACDSAFARTQGWLHWRALCALDGKKKPGASQETPDSGDPPTQGMRTFRIGTQHPGSAVAGQAMDSLQHGNGTVVPFHGTPRERHPDVLRAVGGDGLVQ